MKGYSESAKVACITNGATKQFMIAQFELKQDQMCSGEFASNPSGDPQVFDWTGSTSTLTTLDITDMTCVDPTYFRCNSIKDDGSSASSFTVLDLKGDDKQIVISVESDSDNGVLTTKVGLKCEHTTDPSISFTSNFFEYSVTPKCSSTDAVQASTSTTPSAMKSDYFGSGSSTISFDAT